MQLTCLKPFHCKCKKHAHVRDLRSALSGKRQLNASIKVFYTFIFYITNNMKPANQELQ